MSDHRFGANGYCDYCSISESYAIGINGLCTRQENGWQLNPVDAWTVLNSLESELNNPVIIECPESVDLTKLAAELAANRGGQDNALAQERFLAILCKYLS